MKHAIEKEKKKLSFHPSFYRWNFDSFCEICVFSLVRMLITSEKSKNADLQPILLFSVMTFENNAFVFSVQ